MHWSCENHLSSTDLTLWIIILPLVKCEKELHEIYVVLLDNSKGVSRRMDKRKIWIRAY